jgi:hypothetical protein
MRHFKTVSAERPALASDEIATITALVGLLTAVVGLLGEISTVFGVSFAIVHKGTSGTTP